MTRVFMNGKIYIEREQFAQAMLVKDGKVVAVGTDADILAQAGDAEQVDLQGRTVIPGFNDSHLHLAMLGDNLTQVPLHNTGSMAELIQRGKDFMEKNPLPDGAPLRGFGWNQDYFADGKVMPTRYDLDKIATDRPVVFERACGHATAVNSKALEIIGLKATDPQPDGGEFGITDGEPNGLFFERAADLLKCFSPAATPENSAAKIKTAMDYAASMGITHVQSHDMGETSYNEVLAAADLLRQQNAFTTRYYAQMGFNSPDTLKAFIAEGHRCGDGDDLFRIGSVKLFVDGSLGARTALMLGSYADDPGAIGIKTLPDEVFDEIVRISDENGFPVVTHAIGDGAVQVCIDSYSKVIGDGPNKNRHSINHCQITSMAQLEAIRDKDICVQAQPIFIHYDMNIVRQRAGEALAETSYAFGTLTRMGVHLAYGTDCPVEDLNPYDNLYCAVTRKGLNSDEVYLEGEKVDIYTAIDNYTVGSAYLSLNEDVCGRLQPGYFADFVVLDADIFTVPDEEIRKIRPVATYLGGNVVYQA
ncbi:MAG: amidohydrolase [Clostridia bacterium]|nr:amidohydrolase [Clostridia bacterium]